MPTFVDVDDPYVYSGPNALLLFPQPVDSAVRQREVTVDTESRIQIPKMDAAIMVGSLRAAVIPSSLSQSDPDPHSLRSRSSAGL